MSFTGLDLSTATDIKLGSQQVSSVYYGSQLIWPIHDYSLDYFTIESTEDNNSANFFRLARDRSTQLYYSLDNGNNWVLWPYYDDTIVVPIPLNIGDKILIKCTSPTITTTGSMPGMGTLANTDKGIKVYGNIMSLVYGDNFINQTNLSSYSYVFSNLFNGFAGALDVTNLILPATTLANYCYYSMFGDTYITTSPKLPATTLVEGCYQSMFVSCNSLTTPPELPATTLASGCYKNMFSMCTSLTTAPELPATTLAQSCYSSMFEGCTSLTTVPELPATILANNCYETMFGSCTSLTSAPELPATTLATGCYRWMFTWCENLNYIKCLATTNIDPNTTTMNWTQGVASTGTFYKDANTTWPTGDSGIPSGWQVVNV